MSIKTIKMQLFTEKAQERYDTSVGKWLKPRCQERTDSNADELLAFINNHLHSTNTRPYLTAIFNIPYLSEIFSIQNLQFIIIL